MCELWSAGLRVAYVALALPFVGGMIDEVQLEPSATHSSDIFIDFPPLDELDKAWTDGCIQEKDDDNFYGEELCTRDIKLLRPGEWC